MRDYKGVIFTVITGKYDSLKRIPDELKNYEYRYVCLTEGYAPHTRGKNWEVVPIQELNPPKLPNECYLQRWAKIIGGIEYFKKPTIYIDGSHEIVGDITELFASNMVLKYHPHRDCVYDEAAACKMLKKANPVMIDKQMAAYRKLGMPKGFGMFETGVIVRPYREDVLSFCRLWWKELQAYTHRDQLSITKVLWQTGINFMPAEYNLIHSYLKLHKHSNEFQNGIRKNNKRPA